MIGPSTIDGVTYPTEFRGSVLPKFNESELRDPHALTCAAAEIYAMRRARDRTLPECLMGEPGWDILLQLYCSHPRPISVAALSSGSGVLSSTGARWITALRAEGLIKHTDGSCDAGSVLVSLSDNGHRTVATCLRTMLRRAET